MAEKPRLLYILHAYHNRAGTEAHTKTLARLLQEDFEIYLAYPENGLLHLMTPAGEEQHLPGDPPLWPVTPYTLAVTENSLDWILRTVNPDLIHVQHWIYWPLSVLDMAIATGKPVALSFHDYYAITPHFTMEDVAEPAECFTPAYAQRLGHPDSLKYLLDRRELLSRVLRDVTVRLAPSRFTAEVIRAIYPLTIDVIEHGIKPFDAAPIRPSGPVRFGYLGSLIPQKGWQVLLEAFARVRSVHPDATLEIWGGSIDKPMPGVTAHGVYNDSDIGKAVSSFDVGVIPSLFRESYSLTLSELRMGGRPVVASAIGALTERISENADGKLVKPADAGALAAALGWFCENEGWRHWSIPKPRTEDEMARDYRALYQAMLMRS